MPRPLRLLTVGHSYVVGLNRRLPHEMARAGAGRWDVTCAAPQFVHGDLRPIRLEPFAGEANRLVPVPAYLTFKPHVMLYGRTLRRLVAEPWDVIHGWEEPFTLAAAQLARWARGRPLVLYTYQNLSKSYPPPFRWTERFAIGRCAGWIAGGRTVEAALKDRPGYAEKPRRIITLGVDVETFRPDRAAGATVRRQLGWDADGPPVVGYLGRFTPEKGIGVLTASLDAVRSPWRALFVGGGPREDELRAWAARHGDRVRVVTGVPHAAVPGHLNAMDVLAAPSQTMPAWKEQLGRMLIEAMACGVAVTGSDSGEIPFVIADAGLVLSEADVPAWAAALGSLIENPARRAEVAAAGLERAHAAFAWSVVARQTLDFFDELVSRPRG